MNRRRLQSSLFVCVTLLLLMFAPTSAQFKTQTLENLETGREREREKEASEKATRDAESYKTKDPKSSTGGTTGGGTGQGGCPCWDVNCCPERTKAK